LELKTVILEVPENSSLEAGLIFSKPDSSNGFEASGRYSPFFAFSGEVVFGASSLEPKKNGLSDWILAGSFRFLLTYDLHFWQNNLL
jgi:hypothetical protein